MQEMGQNFNVVGRGPEPDQTLGPLSMLSTAIAVSPSREVHQGPHDHTAIFTPAYKPPRSSRLFLSAHLIILILIIPFVGITTIIINNVIFPMVVIIGPASICVSWNVRGIIYRVILMVMASSHWTNTGKRKRLQGVLVIN
jgi:hypothetical protein